MAKLNGLETVLDFLKGLQPKLAAQIAKKVLALSWSSISAVKSEALDNKSLRFYALNISSYIAFLIFVCQLYPFVLLG